MSVLGLIMNFSPYLRFAIIRFPFAILEVSFVNDTSVDMLTKLYTISGTTKKSASGKNNKIYDKSHKIK